MTFIWPSYLIFICSLCLENSSFRFSLDFTPIATFTFKQLLAAKDLGSCVHVLDQPLIYMTVHLHRYSRTSTWITLGIHKFIFVVKAQTKVFSLIHGLYTYMCMCDLKGYGFSVILVRDRVSTLAILVSNIQ